MVQTSETGSSAECAVYLAGGFHSGWQDIVKMKLTGFRFFDPREHRLEAPGEYTKWDLDAIQQSDWVFAYLETSNPGGYALALEVGFATALSKKILLVDEKSVTDATLARSLAMLHVCSDACLSSLEEGIEYMKNVQVQSAARRGTSGA
jgi:nucleoside 2-deoxyribosyltransferase